MAAKLRGELRGRFMDDSFEACPVCLAVFSNTTTKPYSLPCGHKYCTVCVNKLKTQGQVICPACRQEHEELNVDHVPVCYTRDPVLKKLKALAVSPAKPGKQTVYHTNDTGGSRVYHFRRMQSTAIKFKVRAQHDAAICLSPVKSAGNTGYEVFIGGWGGNESVIRKRGSGKDLCKVYTPNIMQGGAEFLAFWIKIHKGVIKVGKSGVKEAFMTYCDLAPVQSLSWYGYSTGWGADGDWIFLDQPGASSPGVAFDSDDDCSDTKGPLQYKRPAQWVPSSKGCFPLCPVSAGRGQHGEVYVGLAHHAEAYLVGMVVPEHGCCYVPFDGHALPKQEYFMLNQREDVDLVWVRCSKGNVPVGALEGGVSENGEVLFIGRVKMGNTVLVGKIHPSHCQCYVARGGTEHGYKNYEVLCVRTVTVEM